MKSTTDGQVPDRCYYYLLDWRDSNLREFAEITGKDKVKELNTAAFWIIFDYVVKKDKTYWGSTQAKVPDDKALLLASIAPEGRDMGFSVDGSESFSLVEIIMANEDFTVIDVLILQKLEVGEFATFGMGADVKRVV